MVSAIGKKAKEIKPKVDDNPSWASDEMPHYVMNAKRANGMAHEHPFCRADMPTYVAVDLMSYLTQYPIKHPACY